jgi:hypothetical protein
LWLLLKIGVDKFLQDLLFFICKEHLKVVIEIGLVLQNNPWLIFTLGFSPPAGVDDALQIFDCLLEDCVRGGLP